MPVRVGINGFGRIGRNTLKGILKNYESAIEVVAINDLTDVETCAHLFKYDSIYGVFPGEVRAGTGSIRIGSSDIRVFSCRSPKEVPWNDVNADVVVESTGIFRERDLAAGHLRGSVKKVIISAPAKGEDVTIVPGVNDGDYVPESHRIISCASCTTNCVAQVVKVIDDNLDILGGTFCTVHAYSNDQSIIDQPHKDLRRARALAFNTVLTTTGAADAVGKVIPQVKGKLHAVAYRVPVHCGSLVDCTFITKKQTSKEKVNGLFLKAADKDSRNIIRYTELPLVSIDFCGDPHSAIIDGMSTEVLNGTMVRVIAWYDNEWSYSVRIGDLIAHVMDVG